MRRLNFTENYSILRYIINYTLILIIKRYLCKGFRVYFFLLTTSRLMSKQLFGMIPRKNDSIGYEISHNESKRNITSNLLFSFLIRVTKVS